MIDNNNNNETNKYLNARIRRYSIVQYDRAKNKLFWSSTRSVPIWRLIYYYKPSSLFSRQNFQWIILKADNKPVKYIFLYGQLLYFTTFYNRLKMFDLQIFNLIVFRIFIIQLVIIGLSSAVVELYKRLRWWYTLYNIHIIIATYHLESICISIIFKYRM